MKKIILLLSSCLVILAACQSGANNEVNDAKNNETTSNEEQLETNSGVYLEQHGLDWIDIETETGVQSYQLSEEAREDLRYIDENDKVKYHHYHHKGRRMIDYIEKEKYFEKPRHHHENHHHRGHHKMHEHQHGN